MHEQNPLKFRLREKSKYPEEISWFFNDEDLIKKYVLLAVEKCLKKDRDWREIKIGTRSFIRKIIELTAEELGQKISNIDRLERDHHSDFFRVISGVVGEARREADPRDADFTGSGNQTQNEKFKKHKNWKSGIESSHPDPY
ncbi:hypothetical protein COV49_01550 [Candidatus Falkowbacteria bacterium CG11_big_fil_rev_8_21_14_0_20_39_10]|uniref:Uncharacterized protein n=1 Tax=Candidatus Falkowbacteria bacterium CG11_big_fil_rev_8_21_14_0_20_39_10 TaxID=1974570 RepID=A0A2M6K9Q6_9BACT|nr:MAG: hypothetical protein COV49_01550 [Candidatus Falkowbacteria bacterium CG11_big_fil_rev_8_21_14_0_20_39_10]